MKGPAADAGAASSPPSSFVDGATVEDVDECPDLSPATARAAGPTTAAAPATTAVDCKNDRRDTDIRKPPWWPPMDANREKGDTTPPFQTPTPNNHRKLGSSGGRMSRAVVIPPRTQTSPVRSDGMRTRAPDRGPGYRHPAPHLARVLPAENQCRSNAARVRTGPRGPLSMVLRRSRRYPPGTATGNRHRPDRRPP